VAGLTRLLTEFLRSLGAILGIGFVSVRRNFGLALLSIALAFGIWVFITDTAQSTKTGWFAGDIPVQAVSVPEGLTLAAPLPNVTVRVQAPEDVFGNLAVEDFRATINLAGAAVGVMDAEVRVQVLSEADAKVVQVEPPTLTVELKPVVSQLVPVVADVVGSPPIGYEAQAPVLSPEQVLVSGPEDLVKLVKSAVATVNLSGAVGGVRQSYSLVARDDRGFIVAGVSLEPSSAAVEIIVEQKQFERLVAVSPSLRGSPAAGYNVTAVIAAGQGEATFGVAPTVSGPGADLRVVSVTPLVEVLLQGELPLLSSVIPDQVTVTVDLTGLKAGTHQLEPKIEAPPGLQVISASPTTVQVVLESTGASPTPTATPAG
jgi:YbbR domain-containing protein